MVHGLLKLLQMSWDYALWGICKKDETSRDDSFYLAFNMHWEQHEFDLPLVSENMAWRLIINTEEDDDTL